MKEFGELAAGIAERIKIPPPSPCVELPQGRPGPVAQKRLEVIQSPWQRKLKMGTQVAAIVFTLNARALHGLPHPRNIIGDLMWYAHQTTHESLVNYQPPTEHIVYDSQAVRPKGNRYRPPKWKK